MSHCYTKVSETISYQEAELILAHSLEISTHGCLHSFWSVGRQHNMAGICTETKGSPSVPRHEKEEEEMGMIPRRAHMYDQTTSVF